MFNLSPLYFPITAKPNHTSEFLPSHALQPFIRCFWGSVDVESIQQPETETIIPDTCMDIIWDLDRVSGNTNTFSPASMTLHLKSLQTESQGEFNLWDPISFLGSSFFCR